MRGTEVNIKVNNTWLGASEPWSSLTEAGVTVMGLDTVELGSLKNLEGRRLPSISLFIYCEQNGCPYRVMRTNLLKEPLREHSILCLPRTLKLRYHGTWRWQLCELTAYEIILGFGNYSQGWAHFREALRWQTLPTFLESCHQYHWRNLHLHCCVQGFPLIPHSPPDGNWISFSTNLVPPPNSQSGRQHVKGGRT